MMTPAGAIKNVQVYIAGLPFFRRRRPAPHVSKVSSKSPRELSEAKRAELERLCEQLFARQELLTSGRLQLIGLSAVRKRMGKRWLGLQNAIYDICEETIEKYTGRGDIYIRYKDESYILLFLTSSQVESDLKTRLIAEEIKRRLFEDEGVGDVEVRADTARIRTSTIRRDMEFPDSIHNAVETGIEKKRALNRDVCQIMSSAPLQAPPDLSMLRRVEIDAFSDDLCKIQPLVDLGVEADRVPFRAVHYIPVWEQYKGRVIAFICLARDEDSQRPVADHIKFYAGRSKADAGMMDMAILSQIIGWADAHEGGELKSGLICPVHYETLIGVVTKQKYRALCQQISNQMKEKLLFLVLDTPPRAPRLSLAEAISPLKTYSRKICAQIAYDSNIDFESMRLAGFDNVGIIAPPVVANNAESFKRGTAEIRSFITRAKKNHINITFLMGIDHPALAAEAVSSGAYYISGQAIHVPVQDPNDPLTFEDHPFFKMWKSQ